MNAKTLGVVVLFIIIGAGGYYFITRDQGPVEQTPPQEEEETAFDAKNATYTIEGSEVTLVNGFAETEVPAGPVPMTTTTEYFGNEAKGDLNGDGKEDVAFLITQDGGGTGIFFYAVVALKTDDGYKTTNAFFVGDRISPQSTEIYSDARELHVNFAERKPGEPMTATPSVGAVLLLKVTPEGVLEGLME